LHVLQEEQLNRAEQQRADADREPDLSHVTHELRSAGMRLEHAEERRVQP